MILFLLNAWRLTCNVMRYIVSLFTRYPMQFIIVLLFLYIFWQKTRLDNIVGEYSDYKSNIAYQVTLQQAKNELLKRQAEKKVAELTEIHAHNLEAVKHEYEKRNKLADITISDLRERLLSELRSTYTVPPFDTNTERNPEEWRNGYTALSRQYQTLVDACTITTLDFNALRGWADTACEQVECE